MGMSMPIAALPIPDGVTPAWGALHEALDAMSDEQLAALEHDYLYFLEGEELDAESMRARLRQVAATVQGAIEGGSRELNELRVPGWRIYVTGGASWGDPPTELYEHFCDLGETGLAEAAGFLIELDSEPLSDHD